MAYFYLAAAMITGMVNTLGGTLYNRKVSDCKDTTAIYNLAHIISVIIGWAIFFAVTPDFSLSVLPYSILFGVCYSISCGCLVPAYKNGSAALTGLILQLSVISASVWGFIFWNSPVTPLSVGGIVLVVVSMVLCFYEKGGEKKKITGKWIFFVSLVFIGNSTCTIVQKTQQLDFDGKYGPQFMLLSVLISSIIYIIVFAKSDKTDIKKTLRRGWYFPVIAGSCNTVMNLFVILLATSSLSPTVVYSTLGVGGITIATLFSAFVLKEKIEKHQYIGIAVGALAVLILSL